MKFFISLIVVLAAGTVFAEGKSPSASDGCGLGWEVTQDKTWLGTTTRGTTNVFVPPSFGLTSGTIGCEKLEIANKDIEKANYAVTNFETLKLEMAQGQGETLSGFAYMMGCEAKAFNSMTKDNYQSIISSPETSAVEMFQNVKVLVESQCS